MPPPTPASSSSYSMPPNKDVYEVHQESFEGKPVRVVCRGQPCPNTELEPCPNTELEPCPLLGLCNLLLLSKGGTSLLDTVKRTDRYVRTKKLQDFVLDHLTGSFAGKVKEGVTSGQKRDQLLMKYQPQLQDLCSKIGYYGNYSRVSTVSVDDDLFVALGITRRHAVILDPEKDACLYNAIKDEFSCNLIVECLKYEAGCEKGEDYEQSYHDKMSLIKNFVLDGPPFTKYGSILEII